MVIRFDSRALDYVKLMLVFIKMYDFIKSEFLPIWITNITTCSEFTSFFLSMWDILYFCYRNSDLNSTTSPWCIGFLPINSDMAPAVGHLTNSVTSSCDKGVVPIRISSIVEHILQLQIEWWFSNSWYHQYLLYPPLIGGITATSSPDLSTISWFHST